MIERAQERFGLWAKTTDAHYSTSNLIAVFQEHADVSAMSEPQFKAFIDRSKLEEWQRVEIRTKDRFGRTTYYGDALRWIRLNDANQALIAFNNAMLNGAIFVHPETYARFEEVSTAMNKVFHYFRINMQSGDDFRESANREEDPIDLYRSEGSRRYEELGTYLRERYWINAKGEAV